MKRQIRRGCFETNSSSTHSLTIMMKSDFDRWMDAKDDAKLYLYDTAYPYDFKDKSKQPEWGKLYTKEEVIHFIEIAEDTKLDPSDEDFDEIFEELRKDYDFKIPEDNEDSNLEYYEDTFTTPSGETVIAFGEYGYDG